MNLRETQNLESLILMSPLERKCSCHFSTFIGNIINLVPKWASNWCRWVPLRPESWQKWGLENMTKNVTKKHWDLFKNGPKRGSKKSDYFVFFQGSIPAWFLGCPWGDSQAQKYVKMEAQTWIFYDFRKLFPRDFGDTLEIFPVFHDLQIDNTRCSVYGCLCLGLGGKPTVDASQMPPRCLPDASQMPAGCFSDASQMSPRWL